MNKNSRKYEMYNHYNVGEEMKSIENAKNTHLGDIKADDQNQYVHRSKS